MRRRFSAEEWRAWLEAQRQSGLTVADFCDEIGVSPNSFYLWRRKLSAMPRSRGRSPRSSSVALADTPTFLPLQVVATRNVEVDLPCGAVLRIPPESGALAQVLAALLQAGESTAC